MSDLRIEFHAPAHLLEHLPHPIPAAKCIPDWLSSMPTHVPTAASSPHVAEPVGTVKNCMPFRDAMACGYIIPVPTDITFTMEGDQLRIDVADFDLPLVGFHNGDQLLGAPYANMPIVKFHTPWLIRTPAGYSTLVLPPLNRFATPFHLLSGLVETDTYYRQVAFPAICTLRPGETFKFARGSPLVQVVPMARESWTSTVAPWDAEANAAQDRQWEADRHMYRDAHWAKKNYK